MEQFLAFLVKNPFHLVLFGIAVVTGGMLIWPLVSRLARPGRDVGPLEAVQLINRRDAIVVDVAGPTMFVVEGDDLDLLASGATLVEISGRYGWTRPAP